MADVIFPGEAPGGNIGSTRLPDNLDLSIWQGDAQHFLIKMETDLGVAIDLTGYTAQATIRKDFTDPTEYNFTCTIQNGNEVKLYMPSSITGTIPAGDYVWNFQLRDASGDVRTYIAGDVKIYAQVDDNA